MAHCTLRGLETALPPLILIAYFLLDVVRTLRSAGRVGVGRDTMRCLLICLTGSFVAVVFLLVVATVSHVRRTMDDISYYLMIAGSVPLLKLHTESVSALLAPPRVQPTDTMHYDSPRG